MRIFPKFAALAAATMVFASCGMVGIIKDAAKVAEEALEISEGKMFTVKNGTVKYNNGTTLTFKNYGKNWATIDELEGSGTIITDDYMYVLDLANRTYTKTANWGYEFAGCPYIFWETLYEFGDDNTPAAVSKGKRNIAGKSCKIYEVEGEIAGGWNRILFITSEMEAIAWSDNCTESMFSVDGFTEENEN